MASALHHYWVASKAQARGYVKLEERSWMSNFAEKRHLKEEAIEVAKIAKDMAAKKKEFVRLVNSNASHESIHKKIEQIVELYEMEYRDLHEIMHQSKVLLHRTEGLLNRLEYDAKSFKVKKIERKVIGLDQKVQKMLLHIQRQTLREHLDISHEAEILGVELQRRAEALRKSA